MKGKILGSRYKIIEYLAEGGFGRTYLAEDTQIPGKDICLVKQLYLKSSSPQFLHVARRLFKTEASTLHILGHHAQIPTLLAYFEEEEKFYLVQQYIKGEILTKELERGEVWSERQVIDLLRDVLKILQFIHAQGVIHRDIKPDNLIRRQGDRKLVLVDFGTVKQVLQGQQTNLGQLTVAVGTQGYMPTEQARGKPRPTSDLYALGIMAIQALTGILPIDLEEDEEGEIIWESKVSSELAQILTQMTRYHFKDRYQSATEVLEALDRLPTANMTKPQSITTDFQSFATDAVETTEVRVSAKSASEPSPVTASMVDEPVSNHLLANESQEAIAFSNRLNQSEVKVQSPAKSAQSSKKVIVSLIVALGLIISIGVYLLLRQSSSETEIDLPADSNDRPSIPSDRQLPTEPSNPTERMQQGEGFREDL